MVKSNPKQAKEALPVIENLPTTAIVKYTLVAEPALDFELQREIERERWSKAQDKWKSEQDRDDRLKQTWAARMDKFKEDAERKRLRTWDEAQRAAITMAEQKKVAVEAGKAAKAQIKRDLRKNEAFHEFIAAKVAYEKWRCREREHAMMVEAQQKQWRARQDAEQAAEMETRERERRETAEKVAQWKAARAAEQEQKAKEASADTAWKYDMDNNPGAEFYGVREHTRTSKKGKVYTVRAHWRKRRVIKAA